MTYAELALLNKRCLGGKWFVRSWQFPVFKMVL